MKRLISAVLVLLALGAGAFFYLKLRPYLPEPPRGSRLSPAETVLFVQFPNLRQTALRVPKTDLFQIWREPDVQAFFEKPRSKAPWMRTAKERLDELAKVAPGEAFIAFTAMDGPRPSFVGGFSFAGRARQAEALAAHLREDLFPGGEIVSEVRTNWVLFATDAALLGEMKARFGGQPGPTLAASEVFQKSVTPLGVGQDLRIFGKPEALAGRFDVLSELGGQSAPGAVTVLAMATKIEGAKLRDTIFLPGVGEGKPGGLSRTTIPLASPATLLYYETDLALLPAAPGASPLAAVLPGFAGMENRLAVKGLSWKDLPAAVGPELGVMIEWPEDAALPTVLLASEIRDQVKARGFSDALTGATALGSGWQTDDRGGVAVVTSPPQPIAFIRPALALTDRFALMGMTPEAVEATLPRTKAGAETLGQTPAFQSVVPLLPAEAVAFGYLDFPRLFERVYRLTRPFITLSLAFSPEAGDQFDAGKLPPVESIAKHLSASVIAQTPISGGMLIESVGSLTIPQLLVGASAGGLASGLPDLSGVLPGISSRPARSKPKKRAIQPASAAAATPSPEKKAGDH